MKHQPEVGDIHPHVA